MPAAKKKSELNDYYSFTHAERLRLLRDNIPPSIRKLKLWLLWKGVFDSTRGKWDKLPYYATGSPRTANGTPEDRKNLVDFNTAIKAFSKDQRMTGLGLAPLSKSNVVAVDLDHTDTETVSGEFLEFLSGISYTEKSPSGRGARILFSGAALSRKKAPVEIYGTSGFVTITGWASNKKMISRYEKVAPLLAEYFSPEQNLSGPAGAKVSARRIREALEDYPNENLDYDSWLTVLMAVHSARKGDQTGHKLALEWSRSSEKHENRKFNAAWESFSKRDPTAPQITFGTLAKLAGHVSKPEDEEKSPVPLAQYAPSEEWKNPPAIPQEIWGGYVRQGIVTVVAGPGGSYKSILLLSMIIQRHAPNARYLEEKITKGKTLIVLAEDTRKDCIRRLHSLSRHFHLLPNQLREEIAFLELNGSGWEELVSIHYGSPKETLTVPHIAREAKRLSCDLIIIETANRVTTDETNPAFRKLIQSLESIASSSGAGVVITAHVSKAAGRAGTEDHHAARGGGALTDNARSVLVLSLPDENSGLGERYRILTHAKSTHSIPHPQRVLEILPLQHCGLPVLSTQASPKERRKEMASLLPWDKAVLLFKRAAETLQKDELSARQLRPYLAGSGLSFSAMEGALEAAEAKGLMISSETSGRGGKHKNYRLA